MSDYHLLYGFQRIGTPVDEHPTKLFSNATVKLSTQEYKSFVEFNYNTYINTGFYCRELVISEISTQKYSPKEYDLFVGIWSCFRLLLNEGVVKLFFQVFPDLTITERQFTYSLDHCSDQEIYYAYTVNIPEDRITPGYMSLVMFLLRAASRIKKTIKVNTITDLLQYPLSEQKYDIILAVFAAHEILSGKIKDTNFNYSSKEFHNGISTYIRNCIIYTGFSSIKKEDLLQDLFDFLVEDYHMIDPYCFTLPGGNPISSHFLSYGINKTSRQLEEEKKEADKKIEVEKPKRATRKSKSITNSPEIIVED